MAQCKHQASLRRVFHDENDNACLCKDVQLMALSINPAVRRAHEAYKYLVLSRMDSI